MQMEKTDNLIVNLTFKFALAIVIFTESLEQRKNSILPISYSEAGLQ